MPRHSKSSGSNRLAAQGKAKAKRSDRSRTTLESSPSTSEGRVPPTLTSSNPLPPVVIDEFSITDCSEFYLPPRFRIDLSIYTHMTELDYITKDPTLWGIVLKLEGQLRDASQLTYDELDKTAPHGLEELWCEWMTEYAKDINDNKGEGTETHIALSSFPLKSSRRKMTRCMFNEGLWYEYKTPSEQLVGYCDCDKATLCTGITLLSTDPIENSIPSSNIPSKYGYRHRLALETGFYALETPDSESLKLLRLVNGDLAEYRKPKSS